MDIIPYIAEMIKHHDEVSVLGFGTLYKQKIPGRFDAAQEVFVPPTKQLAFKPEWDKSTVLAVYISKVRRISLSSAEYFIEKFGKASTEELHKDGKFDFAPLGSFTYANAQVDFKPNDSTIADHSYYGLMALPETAKQLASHTHEEAAVPVAVVEHVEPQVPHVETALGQAHAGAEEVHPDVEQAHASVEPHAVVEPHANITAPYVEDISEQDEKEHDVNAEHATTDHAAPTAEHATSQSVEWTVQNKTKEQQPPIAEPQHSTNTEVAQAQHLHEETPQEPEPVVFEPLGMALWMKIVYSVIILGLLGWIIYQLKPELFSFLQKQPPAAVTGTNAQKNGLKTAQDSLAYADSLTKQKAKEAGLEVLPSKDTMKVSTEKKVPVVAAPESDQPTYDVIVTAVAKKLAEATIKEYKAKGYNAKEIKAGGLLSKISLGTFNNYDSAEVEKKRLSKVLHNKEIWIHTNKKKKKK